MSELAKRASSAKEALAEAAGSRRHDFSVERANELFERIFQEAPIAMAIVDLDYRFVQVNAAMCEMVGYSEQELTQRRTLDITFPEDVELTRQKGQVLLNGGVPSSSFDKRYVRK